MTYSIASSMPEDNDIGAAMSFLQQAEKYSVIACKSMKFLRGGQYVGTFGEEKLK